jgi:hypothetical protein
MGETHARSAAVRANELGRSHSVLVVSDCLRLTLRHTLTLPIVLFRGGVFL